MKYNKAIHGGKKPVYADFDDDFIDFSISLNPLPPTLDFTIPHELIHKYPDDDYSKLKEIIASHHHRKPEEITVGNGSAEVIRTLCHTILGPGKTVMVPPHTFAEYALSSSLTGANIRDDNGPANLTFLCNPENPSGILIAKKKILSTLCQIRDDGGLLCVDEAFIDLAEPKQSVSDTRDENLFVIRTLTKSFAMPGIRFGYGIGDPSLVHDMEVVRAPWTVGAAGQALAIRAFEAYTDLEKSREYITEERNRIVTYITNLGYNCSNSSTNYLLIETDRDASEVQEQFLRYGILVRDCSSFGLPKHIRISVNTHDANSKFLEAFSSCMV